MNGHLLSGVAAFAAILGLVCSTDSFAGDPTTRCTASKLKEVGRYANCRMKAESKAAKKNESPDYSNCLKKFGDKWAKVESQAGGACETTGDEVSIEASITSWASDIAADLSCPGVGVGGACWFLTAIGEDCATTCSGLGRTYDEATRTYTGSDGSNANCEALLDALGADGSGPPLENNACDNGYGCVVEFGDRHRCTDPTTTSTATSGALYRVCACAP